jgi:unsaturated chondroitin disaccharide hydrolase
MKKLINRNSVVFLFVSFLCSLVHAQSSKKDMAQMIDQQFKLAASQYKILEKNVPDSMMPKTVNKNTGKVESSNTKWWCSGFFPGSLLYIYEHTNDQDVLKIAQKRLAIQEKEKHYTGNHDLGFMMYCSFGNAYRLFKKPGDKATIDTAAASLTTRYRPQIKSIQSWNKNQNFNCPVIIDNMMNLELLLWVSQNGGDQRFREVAINHANSTLTNHYRPDHSAFHVLDYSLETGKFVGKNHQGYNDASAWSRGQAWGFYGFTMMYRFVKDEKYLQQARDIAQFILNHPHMPTDKIPYWDFNAPTIPNALRDASAASIIASGLLELSRYTKGKESSNYVDVAKQIIVKLASEEYLAKPGENGGFLLKHGVGFFNANSEVDQPLTYGDYYFLEAMHRYKEWILK